MSILSNEISIIEFKPLPKSLLFYEIAEKPQEEEEEEDAESLEKWANKDCKLEITQKEGFMCKIKLHAKIDYPPDKVFDLLIDPDNSRYFRQIKAVTYRKVLEDNKRGRQRVEIEQAAGWRFLFLSGLFYTHLFVTQDKKKGTMEFKLAKPGLMKNFEGNMIVRPFNKESIDMLDSDEIEQNKGIRFNIMNFFGRKHEDRNKGSTLLTLEQSILPARMPPKPIRGIVSKVSSKVIVQTVQDIKKEVDRLKKGKPIPKKQLRKLKVAKSMRKENLPEYSNIENYSTEKLKKIASFSICNGCDIQEPNSSLNFYLN